MSAYVILKDKFGKTLTVPACIDALSRGRVFHKDTKYIGTFYATDWEEAKRRFDKFFGF